MWQTYLQPETVAEAVHLLHEHAAVARLVAGGTDLIVELERGIRPTTTVIDLSRLRDLKYVRAEGGMIRLGALATHNDVLASAECRA
ncbi:MAG TPA: FAD binding domain-containing protein, partial [Chloroflexia bacterium]|nr:FAD binding domain-containing protein [Chloroflexia bacterium]